MRRRGFTLVELLVVIAILVAMAYMVTAALTPSSASKMREAGRISQATVMGARDRALHANEKRGFRLQFDSANPWLATAIVYVQPIPDEQFPAVNQFTLERVGAGTDVILVRPVAGSAFASAMPTLSQFIQPFPLSRIRIPSGTGQWYTYGYANPTLTLTSSFTDPGASGQIAHQNDAFTSCDIELRNDILPNHQPVYLPSSIVIDMSRSYPASYPTLQPPPNSPTLPVFQDILFSPRGSVTGPAAALGPIHLFLRDVRDALAGPPVANAPNGLDPASPNLVGDQLILTIFPQTGHVAVYPVDTTDANGDGAADDPFGFAKRGQAAGG